MNSYFQGALVQVEVTFENEQGQVADPSAITLVVRVTAGPQTLSTTTYTYGVGNTITRTSTGIYVANIDTTASPGIYSYEWFGTGLVQAAELSAFLVQPSI